MDPPLLLSILWLILTVTLAKDIPGHEDLRMDHCKTKADCNDIDGVCHDPKKHKCHGEYKPGCCTGGCKFCIPKFWCEWKLSEDKFTSIIDKLPFILDSNKNMILPVGKDRIIRVGSSNEYALTIACPGKNNKIKKISGRKVKKSIKMRCIEDNLLEEKKSDSTLREWELEYLLCQNEITSSYIDTDEKCGSTVMTGSMFQIRFNYAEDEDEDDSNENSITLITLCFNEKYETTLWSDHTLRGKNYKARGKLEKRKYIDMEEFKPNMDIIYKPPSQKILIKNILKLEVDKYIMDPKHGRYCEKGHLSPLSDFIIVPEMEASNYYMNIVPQWKHVNQKNWRNIEDRVQDLAKDTCTNMNIISGGHDLQTLVKTVKMPPVQIFLGDFEEKDAESKNKVPIPNILWKIVIAEGKAVVFIVHNFPYLEKVPEHLCEDVCDNLLWLRWFNRYERSKLCSGYTYCCILDKKIYEKITTMPNVGYFPILDNLPKDDNC